MDYYLGDGVYLHVGGSHLVLTTDHHFIPSNPSVSGNVILLDEEVALKLHTHLKGMFERDPIAQADEDRVLKDES